MTYCSIEEAWGTSFSKPESSKSSDNLPYGNIVPENARSNEPEFTQAEYDGDNIYHKSGKPVFTKSTPKKQKRKKSFSRTMNRLPEHTGSRNRYQSGDNVKRLSFNDQNQKVLIDDNLPTYQNSDVPITEYDKELESSLLKQSGTNYREFGNKRPDSPFVTSLEDEETTNYVPNIIEEESIYPSGDERDVEDDSDLGSESEETWKEGLNNYQAESTNIVESPPPTSLRENTVDVTLYIITGIFLIFILDTFVKLGKKRS
jgi:hypothetical protein